MSILTLLTALDSGLIYAILALGVFLSFRTLNTPDLTVDGSIVTGAAISAVMCSAGFNPFLALVCAFLGGAACGMITGFLNTKLRIQALLAGILVMLGLYSINMRIMGGRANIALINEDTVYKSAAEIIPFNHSSLILNLIIVIVAITLFFLFLKTRIGFALRATGDNEDMIKASGVDSQIMRIMGLSLSNAFVGLAGGMLSQYQSYTDVGMGVGMVVIGLASVIIGEVVFGTRTLLQRLIAVALGAILYRFVIAFALELGMEANDLKLVSAIIVTIALAFGMMGDRFSFRKKGGKKSA